MKKFSLIIIALIVLFAPVFAASNKAGAPSGYVYQAVSKYKAGNFTGCIQDMDYLLDNGYKSDIAYYYKALSYSRLGISDKAKEAYEEAAKISKNLSIIEYSNEAVKCIDNPSSCKSEDEKDINNFIMSKKFLHKDVEEELRNKAIEDVKTKINRDEAPTDKDLRYINQSPTDKEIADAVRTFQKLGMNPLNMYQQNPMGQMGGLFGYMTGSDNSDINKTMVQAMMLNQMLPNLSFNSNDK